MKIVFVAPSLRRCGPINVLFGLVKNLVLRNKVYVFSIYSKKDEKDLIDKLFALGAVYKPLHIQSLLKTPQAVHLLQKELNNISPDIVHSHGLQADYCVSRIRGGFKKVSTLHSNIIEDYHFQFGFLSALLIPLRIRMLKRFDSTVCCSRSVYDAIKVRSRAPLLYVRNGICLVRDYDAKAIKKGIRKELGLPKNARIFLYCGVLIRLKRVPELIESFVENAGDCEYLVIVGDGEDWNRCKSAARNNKNVLLLGRKEDPSNYYIASDIYVSNSSSEGLSMSVLEALSFDNYLLLSDIPSHRESISIFDGANIGETFMKENYGEMHKKVSVMVGEWPMINKSLLSDERMSREYELIYKEIIKK